MEKNETTGEKRVPTRQCMGCRKRRAKKELVRVVRTPQREVVLDDTGKKDGRGAYLCHCLNCLEIAQKKKSLERALKTPVPETVYRNLAKEMKESET